jgi:hypothetical protein
VLKKAGIIVATAAAGVLAFTPLAFAGEGHHDADKNYGKKDHHAKVVEPAASNTSTGNLSNDCQFGNEGGNPVAGAFGGSSLLGALGAVASAATDATSQLNTLNCTNVNVSDLVDDGSNNNTQQAEQTWIDGSFNGGGRG